MTSLNQCFYSKTFPAIIKPISKNNLLMSTLWTRPLHESLTSHRPYYLIHYPFNWTLPNSPRITEIFRTGPYGERSHFALRGNVLKLQMFVPRGSSFFDLQPPSILSASKTFYLSRCLHVFKYPTDHIYAHTGTFPLNISNTK